MFRSSRPDFIETDSVPDSVEYNYYALFRSSRPDFIETIFLLWSNGTWPRVLFRSSRPDFIETAVAVATGAPMLGIVPVFQAGLH